MCPLGKKLLTVNEQELKRQLNHDVYTCASLCVKFFSKFSMNILSDRLWKLASISFCHDILSLGKQTDCFQIEVKAHLSSRNI